MQYGMLVHMHQTIGDLLKVAPDALFGYRFLDLAEVLDQLREITAIGQLKNDVEIVTFDERRVELDDVLVVQALQQTDLVDTIQARLHVLKFKYPNALQSHVLAGRQVDGSIDDAKLAVADLFDDLKVLELTGDRDTFVAALAVVAIVV